MNIAFLTPEYPHPKTGNSGGIGTSIKNLGFGLAAQGCSVRILVYGQKMDAVFEDHGMIIQQIKNVKLKGLSWFLTRKKIKKIIDQLYENNEIDLVEAPDWTGITSFIKPKKCKIVIRLHGSDTYFCHLDQRPVKWINKFHEKRALNNANGLISVSQFTANLTNKIFGFTKEFVIIPNGIDTSLFTANDDFSFIRRGDGGADVILYYGSLIRKKGLLELPLIFNEVIKKNPNTKLMIVGKDVPDKISGNKSTWQMMQALFTDEAKKKVSYLGSIAHTAIKKQIEKASVCIFPSFAEALPVSWLEAMAMEKAIVCSNIGWANEIIEDGVDGFLVHPKNHTEYANKIVALLENKELQKEIGNNARKKMEHKFSIEIVAKQSLEFYESVIKIKRLKD
ncbi:MAG: glycosyltransferase family 4 protein [Flavobacteriaceae bacterium]|nr:glycosyltransferase family 4 protein [Flavobacteriaceae bacterium]